MSWRGRMLVFASALAALGACGVAAADDRPIVTIPQIELATPKTKLHFGDGAAVRDMLNGLLAEQPGLRVMDWARMRSLRDQRFLDGSDAEGVGREISYAADYHLTATVTYNQDLVNKGGGLGKSKLLVGEIRVELLLKDVDAADNQLVASAVGEARRERKASTRLGFGGAGSSTASGLSMEILKEALEGAVGQLMTRMSLGGTTGDGEPAQGDHKDR